MANRNQAPTVRLRRLAAELRRLREAAGLTQEDVVSRTYLNVATMYRIEHAHSRPQVRTLKTLLDLYDADPDLREECLELLRNARERGWLEAYESTLPRQYTTYIGFEAEADAVWNYESLFIPGLLQTSDYVRAVTHAGLPDAATGEIESRVDVRLQRQDVLHRDPPLSVWAIVDEAALHRLVGGPEVMRDQLGHLLDAAMLPNVTVQVIPYSAGAHAGMHGPFSFLQFNDASVPDVICLESMAGGLFLEKDDEVRRYKVAFEHLRAGAVSPGASRSLIEAIRSQT